MTRLKTILNIRSSDYEYRPMSFIQILFTETLQVRKAEDGDFVFGARKWLITSLRTSKGDCPSTRKQRAHGSLHLSLDHLSLAGHVLVVSPYTSSRIRRTRYVRAGACTRLLLGVRLTTNARGAWCRNGRPGCRTGICAPAISRAGFREEFKEQIDRNLRHAPGLLEHACFRSSCFQAYS